jgi:hypothetical protein
MPKIAVDEAYLNHVIDILNTQIAGEVVAAPGGPLDTVKVKAGYALTPGESLEGSVTSQGGAVKKALDEIGTSATTRAAQLSALIQMTNNAEDLANMSAGEFAQKLPSWVPGGASATPGA